MAKSRSKSRSKSSNKDAAPEDPQGSTSAPQADQGPEPVQRVARHVQPVGPRVLVRVMEAPARLESGLYLPANAKDTTADALLGEVLEVARTLPNADLGGDDDDGPRDAMGTNVSGIPLGALVLFGRERGVKIPWDDTLRLVDTRHVLAMVDEISEDELQ